MIAGGFHEHQPPEPTPEAQRAKTEALAKAFFVAYIEGMSRLDTAKAMKEAAEIDSLRTELQNTNKRLNEEREENAALRSELQLLSGGGKKQRKAKTPPPSPGGGDPEPNPPHGGTTEEKST